MTFRTIKYVTFCESQCPLCGDKMTPLDVQFCNKPAGQLTPVWQCYHCWSGCLWARTDSSKGEECYA
jgi:hypothetical protein